MREKYPDARIGVLANSYNAAVVENNPDVDVIYVYKKAKHTPHKTKLAAWWDNLAIFRQIRKERYDVAIACGSYSSTLARYAFFSGAKMRIGYGKKDKPNLCYNVPMIPPPDDKHEVGKVFDLIRPLDIRSEPGKLILIPNDDELKKCEFYKRTSSRPLLAISISARGKANRLSTEKFIELIDKILILDIANVLLLWAPGSENNPTFPGDDEMAGCISRHFGNRIAAHQTRSLKSLINAIALAGIVVTLDTGSLHMAAALNKITVALMTKGKASTWYPWKTENIVLTAENSVEDIEVNDVLRAVEDSISSYINKNHGTAQGAPLGKGGERGCCS